MSLFMLRKQLTLCFSRADFCYRKGDVRAERALQSIPIKSMYFTKTTINRKFFIINTQQLFYARSARTSPITNVPHYPTSPIHTEEKG